jgi:hypothetical protein
MVKTGSVRFFKPAENQSVGSLEQELVNVILLRQGITDTDQIGFEHNQKNLTTVIYIKEPQRLDAMQKLHLQKDFAEIATRCERHSIILARIPLEVMMDARRSPLLN